MNKAASNTYTEVFQKATADRTTATSLEAAVSLTVGSELTNFSIKQGQVAPLVEGVKVDLKVKLSQKSFTDYLSGNQSFSESYIRGDFKPEGSTGSLLAFIEVFEDTKVCQYLKESEEF